MEYRTMMPGGFELVTTDHTQTVYDGVNLDEEVPGFRTLNIAGREVLGFNVEASQLPGDRDGMSMSSKKLPARVITVTYEMKAEYDLDFQMYFRRLNEILSAHGMKDVEVAFTDDPNHIFYGQVSDFDDVVPYSNHIHSSFDIYCQDPFVYDSKETILSEADGTLIKNHQGHYEVFYAGTAPNNFILRNRFENENGYLSVVNKDSFFAVGDAGEPDSIKINTNDSIVYEQMNDLNRWELNTLDPWYDNAVVQGGFEATKWGVKPTMAYTQEYAEVFHGPSAIFTFEPDVLNEETADSFLADFIIHAQTEGMDDMFATEVGILDQYGERMMSFHCFDHWHGKKEINYYFTLHEIANGEKIRYYTSDQLQAKELNHAQVRFRKKGNNLDFELTDKNGLNFKRSRYSTHFNASGRYANKVYVAAYRNGDGTMYTDFEFRLVHVQKYYNLNGMNDIVNIFAPKDVFEWDTKTGRRYVNGYPLVDGLHLRSDVSMEMAQGINHFEVVKSPWYKGRDNLEFRFRNRYY